MKRTQAGNVNNGSDAGAGGDDGHGDGAENAQDVAARWVVALEDAGVTAETRSECERWCAADSRNAEAYRRAKAMRSALGGLAAVQGNAGLARLRAEVAALGERRETRKQTRAGWGRVVPFGLGLGLAAAAAAAVMVFAPFGSDGWRGEKAVDVRVVTESHAAASVARLVALPDGSTVELNADSRLEVSFGPNERRVTLRSGEAHFSVMKDATRPFVVAVGELAVRAVGTAFNVRIAPAAVEVLVTEGRVAVGQTSVAVAAEGAVPETKATAIAAPAALVPLLEAGQRVVVATSSDASAPVVAPQIEAVDSAAIERALAWQTSVLVFSETPLADAVEQFNRRNRVQIVLGDRELATQKVGGKIRVDSPETFVRVLETSGAIAVERSEAGRIVLRKAR